MSAFSACSQTVNATLLYLITKGCIMCSSELSSDSNSNQAGILNEDYNNIDGNVYSDSSYQCIRFQAFQQPQWHVLCDQNLKEL